MANCPFTYTLEIYDDSTSAYRALTADENTKVYLTNEVAHVPVYATTYSEPNVKLNIDTTDTSLDLAVWQIRVVRSSTYSIVTPTAHFTTDITFRHVCWHMTKYPAALASS